MPFRPLFGLFSPLPTLDFPIDLPGETAWQTLQALTVLNPEWLLDIHKSVPSPSLKPGKGQWLTLGLHI